MSFVDQHPKHATLFKTKGLRRAMERVVTVVICNEIDFLLSDKA